MAKNLCFAFCLLCCVCTVGAAQPGYSIREKIVKTYESKIGVRERTGHNDGTEVESYLSYVWLKPGQPWCAAFVSWTFGQNGVTRARSGGCVALMEQGRTILLRDKPVGTVFKSPESADVFFIWFPEKRRVAHTGFIHIWGKTTVTTVEGNTNEAGSREGDGIYSKRRLKRQIYAVNNYLN